MARPPEVVKKQTKRMQDQIEKASAALQDPNLSEEDAAELEAAIDDFQAKIDKLTGATTGPDPTPTPT